MNRPVITLLTDFGTSDHYAGALRGVILGICRPAQIVDISHEVTPFAISEAAYTLSQAWRCFPKGSVHLVVVDPGVGSSRRPIVAQAGGHYFVAPDNGVLSMVLEGEPGQRVREITKSVWFRKPVSQTFHGRDIFAPVAAHLASGVSMAQFGGMVSDWVQLEFSRPRKVGAGWRGMVLKVDRFGNLITSFRSAWVKELTEKASFRIQAGSGKISRLVASYEETGDDEPFAIYGSGGYLELSVRQKSAAARLGVCAGSAVTLRSGHRSF